jgi:hypothetical protein
MSQPGIKPRLPQWEAHSRKEPFEQLLYKAAPVQVAVTNGLIPGAKNRVLASPHVFESHRSHHYNATAEDEIFKYFTIKRLERLDQGSSPS